MSSDNKFKKIGNQQLDMVGYHSDFTQWNVLARDDEIRVLDFDRFSYRNKYAYVFHNSFFCAKILINNGVNNPSACRKRRLCGGHLSHTFAMSLVKKQKMDNQISTYPSSG